MIAIVKWPLQLVAFGVFWFVVIGLSVAPPYHYSDPEMAQIKVNIIHAATPVGGCRKRSREELEELAPNMRRPTICPRERNTLDLEIELDGETLVLQKARPSGLWGDGPGSIYEKFAVKPGRHQISIKMRDSGNEDVWDYVQEATIDLQPSQNFVVNFATSKGIFLLK